MFWFWINLSEQILLPNAPLWPFDLADYQLCQSLHVCSFTFLFDAVFIYEVF